MDQPLKEIPEILGTLEHALTAADRCLDLARKERERMDAALQASSRRGQEAERQVLEHARQGREELEALEREVPPPIEQESPLSRAPTPSYVQATTSPVADGWLLSPGVETPGSATPTPPRPPSPPG